MLAWAYRLFLIFYLHILHMDITLISYAEIISHIETQMEAPIPLVFNSALQILMSKIFFMYFHSSQENLSSAHAFSLSMKTLDSCIQFISFNIGEKGSQILDRNIFLTFSCLAAFFLLTANLNQVFFKCQKNF